MTRDRASAREGLLRIVRGDFAVRRGHPLPYGASVRRDGVNFSVFSPQATEMMLVLFLPGESEPVLELPLDRRYNKTGDVWHVLVRGLDPGIEYGFRAGCEPNPEPQLFRFDRNRVLIDPHSKAIAGLEQWGEVSTPKGRLESLRSRVVDEEFDWGHEQPLSVPLADSVIYEIHVRGFTRHPSSGVASPGTFSGIVEKIPYLKELGVTAVELMPVTEFEECDLPRSNLLTGEPLRNYWGYQPVVLLRPQGLLRAARRRRPGRARVQGAGEGAPRGGHRGHPRHRLQPHRRGRRARRHVLLARARQPDLLPARSEDRAATSTTRAAATP